MKSQEKLQKSQFLFLSKQIYNLSPLTEHDHVFTQILFWVHTLTVCMDIWHPQTTTNMSNKTWKEA